MAIADLISNGSFSSGQALNWSNWVSSGAFASGGASEAAPTVVAGDTSGTLSYSGLSGLDSGAGANGAGQVSLDVSWQNGGGGTGGDASSLEIRVAGVLIATLTTTAGAGTSASVTYANGASGNLSSLDGSPGFGTLTNWVIDLPSTIPANGALEMTVATGINGPANLDDDIRLDNVSVLVEDGAPDVTDDSVSLTEEEGGGDVDLNALSNDTGSALEVTSVAGSAANIGVAVAGDNGGTFTISANGDVDFDAAGQFEDLGANESAVTSVTYSVSQPDPFDPGAQSVQTSGAVGPSDQTAFFTLNAGEFSNDGTTGISGSVTLSDITQPKFNIVFVMDVSGSTGFSSPTFPGVGDLNNDGDANEVIDAEIAAFRQLSDDIAALGFPASNVDIGFITFESAGDQVLRTNEDDGSNVFKAGSTKLFNELGEVAAGGGTDFESALQETISFLTAQGATASDNNVVYFLSDGIPNNNNVFTDEVATLVNSFNAQINGIGISSGSSLSDLNLLDTTGGAQQVTSIPQLNAALQNPFSDADVVDFRIFVDGVEDASIDVTDLSATPLGFDINAQAISGITQAANAASVIVAEIEFDDGTVLRNTVSVQTPIADTATVTVTVTGVNDAPVAGDDDAVVNEDTPVTIDVLGNDVDVDGDFLTIVSVTDPADGTVTLNPDGTISYDPDSAFDGLGSGETDTVTFDYTVSDGQGGTDTATVTVTVTGVNDDPDAVDDAANVVAGTAVTVDVLGNDSDPNLDALSIFGFTDPTDGDVTQNPDGTLTYTPNPVRDDFTDTFTYTVTDGQGGTDTATVTVTVADNFAPFIPEPVVFFVPEGQTFVSNVPAIDLEFDTITFALAGSGADDSLFSVDETSGALTFIAPPDFEDPNDLDTNNAYQIDITVSDQFNSNTQSIVVNVTDVDDIPNSAPNIDLVTPLGGAIEITGGPDPDRSQLVITNLSNGLLAEVQASDVDLGDSLIFTLFGEDAALFDLNVITGQITLGTPLTDPRGSFDGDSQFELDILVEDGRGGTDVVELDFVLITGA